MKRILIIIINLIFENLRKLPYFTLGILPFILNFKNKNSYEIINYSQLLKKKKVMLFLYVELDHQLEILKTKHGEK